MARPNRVCCLFVTLRKGSVTLGLEDIEDGNKTKMRENQTKKNNKTMRNIASKVDY